MCITRNQLYGLAYKSDTDLETAKKWLDPAYRRRMRPSIEARIAKAAAELGITPPTEAQQPHA